MSKTYEAIYQDGQIHWLSEEPPEGRLLVTAMAEQPQLRTFPIPEAGKIEILGDIVSPIVDESEWECLK